MIGRLAAAALSLLLVALPTLNDKCDLGCDGHSVSQAAAARSCPLHRAAPTQPRPHPGNRRDACGHDHSTIRAAEVGSPITISPGVVCLSATVAQSGVDNLVSVDSSCAALMRIRPSTSRSGPTVLRI